MRFCLTVSCWARRFEMSFWRCSSDVLGAAVVVGGMKLNGMKRAGLMVGIGFLLAVGCCV